MRNLFLAGCFLLFAFRVCSQQGEAPNNVSDPGLSPNGLQASKLSSVPVNIFTGKPNISIPIHSFKMNGIGLNISLEYTGAGGIQVDESPSSVGLGWYLNAGGVITRIVKGMPDDMPTYGYWNSSAIPTDFRSNGNKYYFDSLDAEQDIFQFNYPSGAGSFIIGKNGQVATIPASKVKIIPTFQTAIGIQTLKSFRIVAENGVKYDFEDAELSSFITSGTAFKPRYDSAQYATAWYLTRIISAFNNDTIKFNYIKGKAVSVYEFPKIVYINNSDNSKKFPQAPGRSITTETHKISSIEFPNLTKAIFVYGNGVKYNDSDYVLSKIKIADTIFRKGYLLEYQTNRIYYPADTVPVRPLLKSITPYTLSEKQNSYSFMYNDPMFPFIGSLYDTVHNKKDYWGFYNAAINGTNFIPDVTGYTPYADRAPNLYSLSNTLARFYLPTGGFIQYEYQLNDHYPYAKQSNSLSISPGTNSQNNITLSQVFNSKHEIVFVLDKSVSRDGSAPISGPGNLTINIKSTDGSTLYKTITFSLYDLFYTGMKSWTFNLSNGTYMLQTVLSGGTSISGSFPVSVVWENKNENPSINKVDVGGARLAAVSRYGPDNKWVSLEWYKYVTEDGKSSGFLGDIPRYDYPYREVVNYNGSTTTDYTAVSAQPLSTLSYTQGSPVGYSRVEVRQIGEVQNNGKTVYEFTDLKDVNSNVFTSAFPYTPQSIRSWGIGLPKRISVYDSSGNLLKRTSNTYQVDTVLYTNDNFKSIKLGLTKTIYSGDPDYLATPRTRTFVGEDYYPESGRMYLVQTADTIYQTNGSINTTLQSFTYDTNFNIVKTTSGYDRVRGLSLEQRLYYPYNYTVAGAVGKLRDSAIINTPIATESWIVGDASPRIIGGNVTSFRQLSNGDIKPDTVFSLQANKPVTQSAIGSFDPSKINRNPTYFKPQSFFAAYDSKSNVTEVKEINSGQSNSVILDYSNQFPIANVSNAANSDIAYTSFESDGNGNWSIGSTQRDLSSNLTGKKSYNLSNGNITKSGLSSSQNYLLTVWAKSGASVSVNGSSLSTSIASHNNWYLYQVSLSNISSITITGSGLIDELRLHPKDANMVTYTYEPLVGITSATDPNNTVMYTEYDHLNRIKLVKDKDKNIIKRVDYSDTTMTINANPVWIGIGTDCSHINDAHLDSLFKDINPFSDSLDYVKRVFYKLDCSCYGASSHPELKIINGVCETGTWAVVSSVYKRVLCNELFQYRWVCTWRYCFSNYTTSDYYEETCGTTACTVTCSSE